MQNTHTAEAKFETKSSRSIPNVTSYMIIAIKLKEGDSNLEDTERFREKKTPTHTKHTIDVALKNQIFRLHFIKQTLITKRKSHTPNLKDCCVHGEESLH